MKIKVKQTMDASPDGTTVNTYQEGNEYDMPVSLGKVFVAQKWGKEVGRKKVKPGPEETAQCVPVIEVK